MDAFAQLNKSPISNSVLELIGNTPLVKINKLTGKNDATILAKLEMFNPSGSVKDRIVKYIIEKAERTGELKKGQTIIEATSGNTGISLAFIGNIKEYKTKIVMPKSISLEKRKMIEAFGAELIFEEDEYKSIKLAEELARRENYFLLNQFGSPFNTEAHYKTTGKEILDQTNGKLDVFIAGIGTGGTISGVGKRLKEFNPKIKIVGIEPNVTTKIEGLLNFSDSGYKPPVLDTKVIDEIVRVSDEDAFKMTKKLAKKEGLFVGISSGAVMCVALKKSKELGKGKTIVVILADNGERYLSTKLFE